MFRRTQIRLVALNTIVLLILLNGFSISVYFYTGHRLNKQVDNELRRAEHQFKEHPSSLMEERSPEESEASDILTVVRSGTNMVYSSAVTPTEEADISSLDRSNLKSGIARYRTDGETFRVLTKNIQSDAFGDGKSSYTIQFIYRMHQEQEMLEHLLFVMIWISAAGTIFSILAGYFLANRALQPVKNAWDKQTRFVADASHELRTPLSVMQLNLEHLFRYPDHTVEDEIERISSTIQETRYMSKMVADLLTLARSDTDQAELIGESIIIDEPLDKAVLAFKEVANLKGIKLIAAPPSGLQVLGDEERLYQLFIILLNNAVKYTPAGGSVEICTAKEGGKVRIEIKDTGIGISPDDLPHVFDRFYRGDQARSRGVEGTGLGLSIAKWITDIHSGSIKIESRPSKGTTIILSFPIRKN
ncbi:HAMP domain-containing sensor histidine kinase [Rossellomorea marisflavi]|uniref:sensor histidine kinase n=1 Tax=Rossellomorea marisflavi TaxID=189381 RepID=UPI00296F6E84|nr:HAMP domain-containing sensor histidine kinase [Rossellomorea marisflavi]MDW4524856.1 HAMP domain-containing sensor histidine kinase [Rossellomorea marisflavi]